MNHRRKSEGSNFCNEDGRLCRNEIVALARSVQDKTVGSQTNTTGSQSPDLATPDAPIIGGGTTCHQGEHIIQCTVLHPPHESRPFPRIHHPMVDSLNACTVGQITWIIIQMSFPNVADFEMTQRALHKYRGVPTNDLKWAALGEEKATFHSFNSSSEQMLADIW
jgi:hypothetical protein